MTTMKEEEKKKVNVPNLRFPQFQGEWKKYKVSDILEFFPTNSLSWDQLEYETDNIYNLHYGLIHKGLPTQIELDKCSLPNIKYDSISKNYTLCEDGDIAFADASEDTNDVGKVVEFLNCANKDVVCGLHTIHGRDKSNLTVIGFKGYAFSSKVFRHQIRRLSQGTKIYSISSKNFKDVSIGIPSKEEQAKIATLLRLLDERIATQNKIIEKYESFIKGIRDFLFRKKKKNIKLKDCIACHSSTLTESEVMEDKGVYPVYGAAGIFTHFSQYNVNGDSILIIKDGSNVGKLQYALSKYSIIGTLNYLTAKENVCLKYIYYYMQSFNFEKYKVGSGIPHIYFKDYGNEFIYCPALAEQEKMANALSVIEYKINLEKNILKKYTNQKSYLLQNLFT